jgi:glycosyltransferase involved in cell wall biosynthesis
MSQTQAAAEIIVVDDGSTDDTAEVVGSFGEDVIFIRQPRSGASVARNAGINAAKSEWIAFLDADDEWLPEKLAIQTEHLRRNPDLKWSATNYEIRPMDGSPPRITYEPERFDLPADDKEYFDNYLDAVAEGMALSTITIMIKKQVIIDAGMFCVDQRWAEDSDLFFRIAYRHPRMGYVRRSLSINHFGRAGSLTQSNDLNVSWRCDLIEKHLSLAARWGMTRPFRRCALTLLTRWLRGYVDEPSVDISEMLDRFKDILPLSIRVEMWVRRALPGLASMLFRGYFALKRRLRGGGESE